MLSRLRAIIESYLFVLVAALAIGLFVPQAQSLVAWNTLLLQLIFFISSIKLDIRSFTSNIKDWKIVVGPTLFMLIGLPLLVRILFFFAPSSFDSIAFALFLLAAMPSGMTSPLLVELVGGNQSIALILTIVTSLLAPFTIPLMLSIGYGATVAVDALAMFRTLALVIFLPFVIAMIIKRIAAKPIKRLAPHTRPISTLCLGLLIAGAVAQHADRIIASVSTDGIGVGVILGTLLLFFVALHLLGYSIAWWKKHADRQTISICLTYMNFTLAIYLASAYFSDPKMILVLVLAILPWATLLPVWNKLSARLSHL